MTPTQSHNPHTHIPPLIIYSDKPSFPQWSLAVRLQPQWQWPCILSLLWLHTQGDALHPANSISSPWSTFVHVYVCEWVHKEELIKHLLKRTRCLHPQAEIICRGLIELSINTIVVCPNVEISGCSVLSDKTLRINSSVVLWALNCYSNIF